MAINLNHRITDETFQFKLSDLILTAHANAENKESCSASANCFGEVNGETVVIGSVSCTHKSQCSTGFEWVQCGTVMTECS